MDKKVLIIIIVVVVILACIPAMLLGVAILGTGIVIQNMGDNVVEDTTSKISSMAVQAHNNMFEAYKGEARSKVIAEECIRTVEFFNMKGEKTIEIVNDEIENYKQYNISFEYDKEGYINKVIIKAIN